jgi:hypothetical protein
MQEHNLLALQPLFDYNVGRIFPGRVAQLVRAHGSHP